MDVVRQRVGAFATHVAWFAADVLEVEPPAASHDVWRDRAVFHFLTTDEQRQRCVEKVLTALKPGGFAVVGTLEPDGPQQCSSLPVSRCDRLGLHGTFGEPFELMYNSLEVRTMPSGAPQQFVYRLCRRRTL